MNFKLTDVLIKRKLNRPYNQSLDDFIVLLQAARQALQSENCYLDSITISLEYDDDYCDCGFDNNTDDLFIKGYRPENKTEKIKRLNKLKQQKEAKRFKKEEIKQQRYKEYLELKKEFELDPMSKVELNDINK